MSLEIVSTAASVATFIVIAATAIAAIVQLRHLRTSNQLAGLLNILGRSEDPIFAEWRDETKKIAEERINDPAFRRALEHGDYSRSSSSWIHRERRARWNRCSFGVTDIARFRSDQRVSRHKTSTVEQTDVLGARAEAPSGVSDD